MKICIDCGTENKTDSSICCLCGRPLPYERVVTPYIDGQAKTYEYSSDYMQFNIWVLPVVHSMITISILIIGLTMTDFNFTFTIASSIFVCFYIAFLVLHYNMLPNLTIDGSAIKLLLPFNRTYLISVDDIEGITELNPMFRRNYYRIDLRKLSVIHLFIGLIHGSGGKPSFIIDKGLNDCRELIKILSIKAGVKLEKKLWH